MEMKVKRTLLKNVAEELADIFVKLLRIGDRNGLHIMGAVSKAYTKNLPNYGFFRLVPKEADKYPKSNIQQAGYEDFAIVIQGLIMTQYDFTLETVRLYKCLFPQATIIVSTWDYTAKDVIKQFEDEGCEIVLSKDFKPSGFGNVNYQLCTSLAGVRRAKELGKKYVIKSRTDQRINRHATLGFLRGLLETFPVVADNNIPLKGRIITLGGPLFLPLYFFDLFYFGYVEDMERFFDIPYEQRNIPVSPKYFGQTYGKIFSAECFYKEIPPEIYIVSQFLQKYMDVEYSVKFYWEVIKKYFITIDFDDIGLIWPKYGLSLSSWLEDSNSLSIFLSLMNDTIVYKEDYEKIRANTMIDVSRFFVN